MFLYKAILDDPLPWLEDLVRAQRPQRLPVVFTIDEVRRFIEAVEEPNRLIVKLLYGSELRLLEALTRAQPRCITVHCKSDDRGAVDIQVRRRMAIRIYLGRATATEASQEFIAGHRHAVLAYVDADSIANDEELAERMAIQGWTAVEWDRMGDVSDSSVVEKGEPHVSAYKSAREYGFCLVIYRG